MGLLDEHLNKHTLHAPVKLVIWDLDDTFWKGTLLEGGVTAIGDNIELVKLLATRGIISSICSKNDPEAVEKRLREMEVWDYFVLPSISFQSKGSLIEKIIENLQLRPENVVFVDDNPTVLAEVSFVCPELVCLPSADLLRQQLDADCLKGKDDHELERLKQYRLLADKVVTKQNSTLSDEAFLRQSEIKICIEYDIEPYKDRIIELVNRSNQLNYTKRRLETQEQLEDFFKKLNSFGFNAGVVRVWDKYGDYGVVGFFMTLATLTDYYLEHFVFSCRVMNMGIEQYTYRYLNCPEINIAEPVANPIETFDTIDWITLSAREEAIIRLKDRKIVLIGGCDMLQLSTYCSCESAEFTNRDENGIIKRLDDPFFICGDPELVKASELRPHIPAAKESEMRELSSALRDADAVIVSFYRMMEPNYFKGVDNLTFRLDEDAVTAILRSDWGLWFVRHFQFVNFSREELQGLIRMSFDRLASSTKAGAKIIVMLEETRKLEDNPNELFLKNLYNQFVLRECARIEKMNYLNVTAEVDIRYVHEDGFHMNRQGYLLLAQAAMKIIEGPAPN